MALSAPLPRSTVSRPEPANLQLARKLLEYLMSGDVSPGQRLPGERAMSDALGVGRAALREAIKSLMLLGILEQRQGDGTYLSRRQSDLLPKVIEWGLLLGRNDVSDLLEARYHLEITLAGLAAARRDDAGLDRLRGLIEEMRSANAEGDHPRYIDADIGFHLEVAEASGSPVLSGVLGNVRSLLQVWADRVITAAGETATSLAMHEPILAAIERQDVAGAQDAMRAHMDRAKRRLLATISTSTDSVPSGAEAN